MTVGVPTELASNERRVALTPDGATELSGRGISVIIQAGAGGQAPFPDSLYEAGGARVMPERDGVLAESDVVLLVNGPEGGNSEQIVSAMKSGSTLISNLNRANNLHTIQMLIDKSVSAFAINLIPRISRAQSMDALSSMSTIAGYKAVLLAAAKLPKFFPMLMTASGTLPPARVFVIGAGVAGLQAIATAKRLGALVEAFDVRPAVKEQVESLGARFVGLSVTVREAEDASGYAKEVSTDTHRRELELIGERLPKRDVVISTALVPGKSAPILISRESVRGMMPGSVIVDLAAPAGGNCEATVPGETVTVDGVTIVGDLDLISTMAIDASKMYSKNMTELLKLLAPDGSLAIDLEDEIVRATLLTHEGKVVHEPTRLLMERGL